MQAYTINLHMTGGLIMAGTPDRWEWLQSAYHVFQSIGIEDCRLVTPQEARELNPIMSIDGLLGGMWADREGYLDTTGTVHAYARAACNRGAEVIEHSRVLELHQSAEGWDVVPQMGTIRCEHVVNAGRLWEKQVGQMAGAPWDYGMDLFAEQADRIEKELIMGFERYPYLQNVGVNIWVNGAFTFSPDGNSLVGSVPRKCGYWCACAVMAGFLQGGGKILAEWIINGEPEADVYGMDVARYGDWAANKRHIRETTGQFYSRRFVMTYPNEQLPAGRPLKMAPAHDAMSAAGTKWGGSWDLEVLLYFAPLGLEETPTLKRSNAFPIVVEECAAIRQGVWVLDITGFARYEVTGENAHDWLNGLMASRLPGWRRCWERMGGSMAI